MRVVVCDGTSPYHERCDALAVHDVRPRARIKQMLHTFEMACMCEYVMHVRVRANGGIAGALCYTAPLTGLYCAVLHCTAPLD